MMELDNDLIDDIVEQMKGQNEDLKDTLMQQIDQILTENGEKIIENFMVLVKQV